MCVSPEHFRRPLRALSTFSRSLKEKAEIFFVFSFNGAGSSVLIRKQEFKLFSNRILKNVKLDSKESDSNDNNGEGLIVPSYFFLEMSTLMALYAKATSRNICWSATTMHYLLSDEKPFKKAAIALKPLVNVSILYNLIMEVREE